MERPVEGTEDGVCQSFVALYQSEEFCAVLSGLRSEGELMCK